MTSAVGIATGLFTSAGAGVLGALLIPPFQELRRFFFAANTALALAFLGFAAPYRPSPFRLFGDQAAATGRPAAFASACAAVAMILAVAYIAALYLPGGRPARGLLGAAAVAAFAAAGADGWSAARAGVPGWVFGLNAILAAGLLGSVIVTMILGHWYLVRPRLAGGHLVRLTRVFGAALLLRAAMFGIGLLLTGVRWSGGPGEYVSDLAVHRGFFFWQRVFFGILGPAVFGWMIHETARIRSTQSATGILYVAVVFVLIGEFLARYLTVRGLGPL